MTNKSLNNHPENSKLVLTIDVGNSNIFIGIFSDEKIIKDFKVHTNHERTSDEYAVLFNQLFLQNSFRASGFSGAIISSVVPRLTKKLVSACKLLFNIEPIIVSYNSDSGVLINIDNKKELGNDFISAAAGVIIKYPLPAIVIDLGTASKIFAIDKNKTILGVSIFPGLSISLDALSKKTAQLPFISIEQSPPVIGKNTVDSISSGVIYSTAGSIDHLTDLYKKELKEVGSIVATGGISQSIIKYCKNNIILDEKLILHGLYSIYKREKIDFREV